MGASVACGPIRTPFDLAVLLSYSIAQTCTMLSSTTPEKPLSGIPFLDRDHAWWLTSIALALRVAFFLLILFRFGDAGFILPPFSDGQGYVTIAENMLDGNGFSRNEGPPYISDTKRVPIYPLYLAATFALTGGAWWLAALLQTLMSAALVLIVYNVADKLFGKPAAFFAGLIVTIYPFGIFLSSQLLAETLFTVLLFSGFLFFIRSFTEAPYRNILVAGILFGLATLVKPAGQYIPFLLVPFIALGHRRIQRLLYPLAFIACFLVVISPWIVRNYHASGVATLSYEANILFDLHLAGYRAYEETGTASLFYKYRSAESEEALLAVSRVEYMKRVISVAGHDPIGFSRYLILTTVPFVFGDGFVTMVVALSPTSSIPAWDFSTSASALGRTIGFGVLPPSLVLLSIANKALWGLILVCAGIGSFLLVRSPGANRLIGLGIFVTIAYFMFAGGPVQSARYRMPVEPPIFVMAGIGMVTLVRLLQKRVNRSQFHTQAPSTPQ